MKFTTLAVALAIGNTFVASLNIRGAHRRQLSRISNVHIGLPGAKADGLSADAPIVKRVPSKRAKRCKTRSSSVSSGHPTSSKFITSTTPAFIAPPVVSTTTHEVVVATTPPPVVIHSPTTHAAPPPAPTTTAAAVAINNIGSGSEGTSSSDISAYLSAHNTVRAQHGASPLTWSDSLAAAAKTWTEKCVFQHSGGSLGPYGENLAAGSGDYSIANAVKAWTDEESQYNPSNPQASHYTQVVWKGTTQVGCAVISCNLPAFTPNFWPAKYYVCEYSAQGNIIGAFAQNVQ